jgi:hypothetical protein
MDTISEIWADTAVWSPIIPPLKPALSDDKITYRYMATSKTKEPQSPNLNSLMDANTVKSFTETDSTQPERQVGSKPTYHSKGKKVAVSSADKTSASRPRNRTVGLRSALRPHEAVIRTEAPSLAEIGLHAPQWGYAIARAA